MRFVLGAGLPGGRRGFGGAIDSQTGSSVIIPSNAEADPEGIANGELVAAVENCWGLAESVAVPAVD
jgi:hypothetical protein